MLGRIDLRQNGLWVIFVSRLNHEFMSSAIGCAVPTYLWSHLCWLPKYNCMLCGWKFPRSSKHSTDLWRIHFLTRENKFLNAAIDKYTKQYTQKFISLKYFIAWQLSNKFLFKLNNILLDQIIYIESIKFHWPK